MQGPININAGRVRVVEFMKMPVEAIRVLIKAVRVHISDCRGAQRGC